MSWICLMYHDVLPFTRSRGGGGERFAVPLESFETMLDAIRASEFVGCSIDQALRGTGRRVAISFDDGTQSQLDYAFPALLARGMTATFFVTTDFVGRSGFMSWSELREMASSGMSVQSHTKSHPFLSELDEDGLASELAGSKAALDEELGQDTTQISLPGGDSPRRGLRHLFKKHGYDVVLGSRWGTNADSVDGTVRSPLRRCAMRGVISMEAAHRVLSSDAWLSVTKASKEATLNAVRATLGATRYTTWRRRFLDAL